MGSISNRYGATPRKCYHYTIVKASGNAKIFETAMLPTSSAHCSSFSRQNFKKFSRSLEHQCSCRTQSTIRKSDDMVPSKSRPKCAKKPNFKPSYLPQMGADSPQTKTVFLRVARAIRCMGQMGVQTPEGGKPQKCTKSAPPQFSIHIARILRS